MRHVLALALIATGCGGGGGGPSPDAPPIPPADAPIDAPIAPAFRNPVDMADDQLALAALQIMGANVPGARTASCNGCHGLTRQNLRYWRSLSDTAMASCFTDLAVGSSESAQATIACLRAMPQLATSDFSTKKLGIFATATHLPWFQFAFWRAYGGTGADRQAELTATAGMPKDGAKLAQADFDLLAEWYARGLPALDQTLPADPAPTTCTAGISADVRAHVNALKTTGWRAINATNQMAMHGCGAATDPKLCLADRPLAVDQSYGAGWDLPGRGRMRVLAEVEYESSFWTRSSPDGRFVAHGVRDVAGSYILDLQRDALRIAISANYDPGFFPDNSGFMFQGGSRNVCGQSVLTSNPTAISMTEPACTSVGTIGLYQHVGRALAGDYFAIDSRFVSDDGGHEATLEDPVASFGSSASLSFIPMIWTGSTYQAKPEVTIKTPFEGDTVISPSAKLVLTRVAGPDDLQLGYVLRAVHATMTGQSYTIEAPEIARYCVSGGKPAFSYDERWLVLHHYVTAADAVELGFTGPTDPAFQPYLTKGAANLYLIDLAVGASVRLTQMQPGQYALFPHFRSDGWIYADVRDTNAKREYMVASDAALLAE
jgi:hypothetical protein